MAKPSNKQQEETKLHKKLIELHNRGQSDYCEVRGSAIHGRGVYATQFIPKETKIIEYVGELIDKEESERRANKQHAKSLKTGDAAVYIFTLSKKWDIDGNVPWNTARLIFIHSLRDIQPGEELTFDYGFDVDCYEDHPCRCGTNECIGYIVSREQWPELKKRLKAK
jgi:SET domain-containing protein